MALKVGTENKRNVIIAIVLFVLLAYLAIHQIFGGSSTPAPVQVAAPVTVRPTPAEPQPTAPSATTVRTTARVNGVEARKLPSSNLDPALHLEKLASSESIDYEGNGRNIFSADSAPPVVIDQPLASAREVAPEVVNPGPPPPPQPPAIELKYFGYAASKDGKRSAFLQHGEDIFEAGVGEIVNHRYKVVSVMPGSVQVTDMSYNNTQTLPMSGN